MVVIFKFQEFVSVRGGKVPNKTSKVVAFKKVSKGSHSLHSFLTNVFATIVNFLPEMPEHSSRARVGKRELRLSHEPSLKALAPTSLL